MKEQIKKPVVSYVDFLKLKKKHLEDLDPIKRFGQVLCEMFGVNDDRLFRASSVAEARVIFDGLVEWTF